ncbi:MAG TPA: hypothetical protein VID67_01935 [Rhizomicrobium sp.]|jgi:hypothetical protein
MMMGSKTSFIPTTLFFLLGALSSSTALSNLPAGFPRTLEKQSDCMLRVVRSTPGIDRGKLGVMRWDGKPRPYVEFRGKIVRGFRPIIRFVGSPPDDSSSSEYSFEAMLGGIFVPPDKGPPDYGASRVADGWNARCGVHADILFN